METTFTKKILPKYFEAIKDGTKTFEIRQLDKDFLPKTGDTVTLAEYDDSKNEYTGREIKVLIKYILHNAPEYGLKEGYCIFSFKILTEEENK